MRLSKFYSFVLFLGLILGIGLLGTVKTINAQDTDDDSVERNQDDDDDDMYESDEQQKELTKQATITKEAAMKIALARVPGEVVESEIDKEHGKLVWEFEIKTADGKVFEVVVDAKTGDIVGVEDETDEDDDDDPPGN